jgi:hypothetical protein
MTKEHALLQRFARIDALRRGATTPGERLAAEQAQARVADQIAAQQARDPVRAFVHAYVADLAVPPDDPPPQASLPDDLEVRGALLRWEHDDLSDRDLARWAREVVDRVVLPRDSADPAARRAELCLALASRRLGGLVREDLRGIRHFLDGGPWEDWFALLATAAARGRRAARAHAAPG